MTDVPTSDEVTMALDGYGETIRPTPNLPAPVAAHVDGVAFDGLRRAILAMHDQAVELLAARDAPAAAAGLVRLGQLIADLRDVERLIRSALPEMIRDDYDGALVVEGVGVFEPRWQRSGERCDWPELWNALMSKVAERGLEVIADVAPLTPSSLPRKTAMKAIGLNPADYLSGGKSTLGLKVTKELG